jgi:glyoxylase I family protein
MTGTIFHHIALNCKDMGATEQFYSTHFGFRRARTITLPDAQIIFLRAGDAYLELFQAKSDSVAAQQDGPAAQGIRHVAFRVDDVDAKLAEMGAAAKVTLGPFGFDAFIPGWRTVWVTDPDGNIIEISQGFRDESNLPVNVVNWREGMN